MGWWQEEKLTLGDEPFMICQGALEEVISKYEKHVGRPPMLEEVLTYFRHALNTVGADSLPDLESIEVQSVNIRSKKTPKRQSYEVGDYFAIPLEGEYAYGRYVDDSSGGLVEIYELFTDSLLTLGQLLDRRPAVRTWKYVFSREAFARRRWIVLGSAKMDPDYEYPLFYLGYGGLALRSTGALRQRYSRSDIGGEPETLEGIESHIIWGPETIEDHLKRRVPDPWPRIVENWKRDGIPWRSRKTKYPVFYRDLPLAKMRFVILRLETFSEADLQWLLQLKSIQFLTIECETLKSRKKQQEIAETLKKKLPKLKRIFINGHTHKRDEETGEWTLEE